MQINFYVPNLRSNRTSELISKINISKINPLHNMTDGVYKVRFIKTLTYLMKVIMMEMLRVYFFMHISLSSVIS